MNTEQKTPESHESGYTLNDNTIEGMNARKNEKALYTWEITRVHKKKLARNGFRFLVLSVNIPTKREDGQTVTTYQAHYELSEATIKNDHAFKDYCVRGFNSMRQQLLEKGIEIPN